MPEPIIRTLDLVSIAAPAPVDRGSAGSEIQPVTVGSLAPTTSPRCDLSFEFAKIDDHGRFSGRPILRELHWAAGTELDFVLHDSTVIVRARRGTAIQVTGRGLIQVPLAIRRWLSWNSGHRLLLASSSRIGVLVLADALILHDFAHTKFDALTEEPSK